MSCWRDSAPQSPFLKAELPWWTIGILMQFSTIVFWASLFKSMLHQKFFCLEKFAQYFSWILHVCKNTLSLDQLFISYFMLFTLSLISRSLESRLSNVQTTMKQHWRHVLLPIITKPNLWLITTVKRVSFLI